LSKKLPSRYGIRTMVPADAEGVARLAGLFEPVSTTVFQGIDAEDVSSWVRERLACPDWDGFVAELEGEIVGFAFCQDMANQPSGFVFPQARETVYLMYLAVDEAFRGQGLARALIAACEKLARDWGRSGLFLDVADDNPALGLYERLGFERLGAQVFLRKTIEP
jgi:ribosomal protein S18 acetylase RimI-like enzyme